MLAVMDPVLTQATSAPSPEEAQAAEQKLATGIKARLSRQEGAEPTARQVTQSEVLDLELDRFRAMDPFSVRHIPFQQLREMTTDQMLGFGWMMTMAPLVRADWLIECPDAQIAAAVDEAFRAIATETFLAFSNDLWYGHQPIVKRFKLGRLGGMYNDPNATDPTADIPVWSSSADALLWREPLAVNPSHCVPLWNEDGGMIGFKFSPVPIPNFDLISAAAAYGYEVIPGKLIDADYAMWCVNEQELNFGSVYGSPRTKRAYRYWWSYWYRWALADRAFENTVDPAKLVYFPTDVDEFIDADDVNNEIEKMRDRALRTGDTARSGATVALPGDVIVGDDGKATSIRKWQISYLEGQQHFADLDQTFAHLDVMKLRSWFIPEQAFIEGRGSTSSRNVAVQLGEVYQESQQLLANRYDKYVSDGMIRQFIQTNFPDRADVPCRKVTRGFGAIDAQVLQTVFTVIGQERGNILPVDMKKLLTMMGIPVLNKKQAEAELKQISKLAAIMAQGEQGDAPGARPQGGAPGSQPRPILPSPRGTQGYNSGVLRTRAGETRYFQPPQRIILADSDGFMQSLPDTPHYTDAGVRSAIIRMRRLFLERYKGRYDSLADYLERQPALYLATEAPAAQTQQQPPPQQLNKQDADKLATRLIEAWLAYEAASEPIEAARSIATVPARFAELLSKIALAGGTGTLKGARLDAEDFGAGVLDPWVSDRVDSSLKSIDDTVRSEAQDWLSSQLQKDATPAAVAAAAREHFADFPATHADRVVRTETRDAYNRGALTALHLAGVAQVQAHDASDGTDVHTDAECLQRDGRIYSVEEAMRLDEHPNGTLYFTPVVTENFSIQRVEEIPVSLNGDGRPAAYDDRTETLYLLSDVDDEQERLCLLVLGDQISLR
jgi:hypothetical protein